MQEYHISKILIISCFAAVLTISLLSGADLQASETVRYDEGKIKSLVQGYIEANMPWPKGTLRIVYPVKLDDLVIQGDRVTHEVVAKMNDGFIGVGLFAVRFYDRGYLVREETVRLVMELVREVVVSDKVLNKDQIIKSDDVHIVKKWFRRIPLDTVSKVEEVVGKRMDASIRPNTEITRNMLKEPIMIKRGNMVKIVLDTGTMQIATQGLSEEDGIQGAIIRVKNMSSKRTIYARVLGESLVGVEF